MIFSAFSIGEKHQDADYTVSSNARRTIRLYLSLENPLLCANMRILRSIRTPLGTRSYTSQTERMTEKRGSRAYHIRSVYHDEPYDTLCAG